MTVGSIGSSQSTNSCSAPGSANSCSPGNSENSNSSSGYGGSSAVSGSLGSGTYGMQTDPSSGASVASLAKQATTGSPLEQGQALRSLDQATGDRAATNALAGAAARPPETCTVEVRFKPVALGADHAFIVTTDANSTNYFRGGPQANNTGLNSPRSSAAEDTTRPAFDSRFGIYGPIVTEYGAYVKGTVDWTTSPSSTQVVDRLPGNCDRIEGQFRTHMDAIEAARTNYMPLNQNSNSTVRETLERAGYPNVRPVQWAPAWNAQLP
jgi:hypothetical protein